MIDSGYFSPGNLADGKPIVDRLLSDGEPYFVLADFAAYAAAQDEVDALYLQPDEWSRKAVLNTLGMGTFSSDRSIREYAERIWRIKPVTVGTDGAVGATSPRHLLAWFSRCNRTAPLSTSLTAWPHGNNSPRPTSTRSSGASPRAALAAGLPRIRAQGRAPGVRRARARARRERVSGRAGRTSAAESS